MVDELRRRLGSSFLIGELADLLRRGDGLGLRPAQRHTLGTDVSYVVDAAFARYAREASDYGGGRARESHGRPETRLAPATSSSSSDGGAVLARAGDHDPLRLDHDRHGRWPAQCSA